MKVFLLIVAISLISGFQARADQDPDNGTFPCHGGTGNIQSITIDDNGYSIDGIPVIKAKWQGQHVLLAQLANGTWWVTGPNWFVNCW